MGSRKQNEIRVCDFCSESKALLYCRADSAKLCLNCDREVHSTNQLFKKHTRCLLCDSCDSLPASIFCHSDSLVLCQNCDWESHKNCRPVHDRRPLEGFSGCPSVSELLNFLGFEDMGKKGSVLDDKNGEDWLDFVVWETPSIVSLGDLIVSNDSADSGHSFQATGVPPLPKDRNAACGMHKEEILGQLREMVKTEARYSGLLEEDDPLSGFEPQEHGEFKVKDNDLDRESIIDQILVPSSETNAHELCDYTDGIPAQRLSPFLDSFVEMNHIVPSKNFDAGDDLGFAQCGQEQSHFLDDSKMFQVMPETGFRELNSQERYSAISRYKEKKKNRRYDRHIRYESRKARAESRTRVKGRFAKMDHLDQTM